MTQLAQTYTIMKLIAIATLLAAAAMAAPEFKPTAKDGPTSPVRALDAVKREYICAEIASASPVSKRTSAALHASSALHAPAADCAKCQADWDKCLTHWGCWFYDCGPACRCQVANNEPQCSECPAGECLA